MTSFVGVEAPEGTDPDTLYYKALAEFRKRCNEGEVEVMHFQTYDSETGEYETVDGPSPMNALAREQGVKKS